MKKIISIFVLLMPVKSLLAQQPFYYYEGKKIPLDISTEKIYVKFKEGKTENQNIAHLSNNKCGHCAEVFG